MNRCKYPGCITIISDLNRPIYRDRFGNVIKNGKGKQRKYCFVHQGPVNVEKRDKYVEDLGRSRDRHGIYEKKGNT